MAPVREPQADEAASLRLVELMIVHGKVHHFELLRQKMQKSAGEERAALPVQRSLKKELSNASEDMDLSINPMLLDTEAAVAVEEMEESLPAEDSDASCPEHGPGAVDRVTLSKRNEKAGSVCYETTPSHLRPKP